MELTGHEHAGLESDAVLATAPDPRALARRNARWVRLGTGEVVFRGARVWRDALLRRLLALADIAAVAAGALAVSVTGDVGRSAWAAVLAPAWLVVAKVQGLYDRDQRALRQLTVDEAPKLFMWALMAAVGTALVSKITPTGALTAADGTRLCVVAFVSAFVFRSGARFLWRRTTPPERTLIVGTGPLAAATRRKLELFPDIHVTVVDERDELTGETLSEQALSLAAIDRVIVASQVTEERVIRDLLALCRREGVKLSVVPPVRGIFGTAVQLNHVADLPIVEYNTWDVSRSTLLLKRALDVAVCSVLLVILLPLFVLIALAVFVESGRPVIFVQRRAGLRGRTFKMLKFRTMRRDAEQRLGELVVLDQLREPVFKLRNDPRVTRVGRLLRRTSLDELPQLINILRGEMTLVGPRPEQVELVAKYLPEQRIRLEVKPGLTGPMQVFGRAELTFEERLAVEREYIENLSIGRDLRLLAMTVVPVISGKGAF